jgi:hypothetical protein
VPYLSLPLYLKAQNRGDWGMFLPFFAEFASEEKKSNWA